ncbi:putative cytochrome c oxidase subunit 5C-4 [Mercurialis annua]|uniref:putative cytochrome c oxidase subunit 5C-4 n=1 Tax=Mercurialis annua TaxID=3986 RepID=UPI0021604FBA|nr:putative cytochrome c oxidase subunit 5C-4 [Mercurialis annua]
MVEVVLVLQVRKMGGHKGPSIIKEIIYGMSIGLAAGLLWKMHHWNNQKRTKEFYNLLERGDISVVVEDE